MWTTLSRMKSVAMKAYIQEHGATAKCRAKGIWRMEMYFVSYNDVGSECELKFPS